MTTEAPQNTTLPQEDEKSTPPEEVSPRWHQRLTRTVRWRAHWLLPNTIPWMHTEADRAYFKQRDVDDNVESRVPVEEELRRPVMWGAELYGPAEAEALYEHLTRLRWSAGGFSLEGGAAKWIRHQRLYGTGGGWYNVDLVVRPQDRSRWFGPHNLAQLPDEVDYLLARFVQLTPSLTCALVGFVFKTSASARYEEELNRDRKSTRTRSRDWHVSMLEPSQLKHRALEAARAEIQTIVGRWFKTNLPGYFCDRSEGRIPTAELLTTNTHLLLGPELGNRTGRSDWRHLISNVSVYDVWTSASCSGLQLSMTRSHGGEDDSLHLVVALRTSDVPEEGIKHYGERDQAAYVRYCHEHLDGILSNYAALAFLKEAAKEVRSSRAALNIGKVRGGKALRGLPSISRTRWLTR